MFNILFPSGAYSPLTKEGTIIVDGVLSSCYAHSPDHDVAHFVLTPLRWFPDIIHWIFGENIGMPFYVEIAAYFGNMIIPQSVTI